MKKAWFSTIARPLIFVAAFIISCNGQSNQKNIENNNPAAITPKTSPQISEYIVSLFEDKRGNLWLGTVSDGAARFDGKTLTCFSTKDGLADNTVVSIAEDKEGNMWFGTHAGASKYDGRMFTNFTEANGLFGSGCKILVDRNGQIWAGTNSGVFRFDGTSFVEFKLPKPAIENPSHKVVAGKVWSILEDKKGNFWFGRDGLGACKFDGKSFTHFTKKDGLCSNNVTSIVEDNKGDIWFGCLSSDFPEFIEEGGLCRYDGNTISTFPQIEGLVKRDIYTIYKDKKGDIWIGATGFGAYRYDGEKLEIFKETDRPDLPLIKYFGVQSILEDRHGVLWFGFSGGLFRFNGTTFSNVTRDGQWR